MTSLAWLGPAMMLLHLSIAIYMLGFTQGRSPIRYLLVTIVFAMIPIWSIKGAEMMRTVWCALFIPIMASDALHLLDMGILRKWDYEANGPFDAPTTSKKGKKIYSNGSVKRGRKGTFTDRLVFGLNQTVNFRKIGTPYQVKNVPEIPPRLAKMTKRQWLIRNSLIFLAAAVVMDLQSLAPPPPPEAQTYCSAKSLDVISRIYHRDWPSLDEIAFRVPIALSTCVFAMIVISGLGKLPALILVALGTSDHNEWKPFYGSLSSAYTIRGFWGEFWHQMLRDPVYQVASFILHRILHIPRAKNWLIGSIKVGTVFFLSAMMHLSSELGTGSSLSDSGSFSFFQSQVIGILIEDIFRRLLFRSKALNELPDIRTVPLWQRVIGHIWTFAWLSISSARYVCIVLTYNDMKPLLGFKLAPRIVAWVQRHLG